jgi:DNA-binding NarL/FixJ family response regulator
VADCGSSGFKEVDAGKAIQSMNAAVSNPGKAQPFAAAITYVRANTIQAYRRSALRPLSILVNNSERVEVEPSLRGLPSRHPHRLAGADQESRGIGGEQNFASASQSSLTPRETEVLKFVAQGLTNGQTALSMKVSIKTVQKHRQSVMNKLNLHDTASLTRYAVTWGILFSNPLSTKCSRQAHVITSEDYWWIPSRATKWITARERQVLKLIAEGLANKQIASELNISIKTVEGHRQGLMNRLNIHEVAGLTRYAISQGFIPHTFRRCSHSL